MRQAMPADAARHVRRRWLASLAGAAVLLAVWPASSGAARGLTTGFADDIYLSGDAGTRAAWLKRSQQENAGILRFNVSWRSIVGARPAHPRSPKDPAYAFAALDAGVRDARARGFQVLLTVYDAPKWAWGRHPASYAEDGTWKPNPKAFGNFAHALALRYSGRFSASGTTLPRVRDFEAWNEPNLAHYLTPQWVAKKPTGPAVYRRILNSFYGGVKSAQRGAKVIAGALSPVGTPPGGNQMRPIVWLRNFFCLNAKLKPKHCKHFHRPRFDVLSMHPITSAGGGRGGGPRQHAALAADVFIADLGKVRRVLHAGERAHRAAGGRHHPLWVTEFWWVTDPPTHEIGIPPKAQARFINLALYLMWKQGASVAINYEIRDIPQFGTGVFTTGGSPKPSARAFKFPFVVHGRKGHSAKVWGKAPRSGKLTVQRKRGNSWRAIKRLHVRSGRIFTTRVHVPKSAKLRAVVGGATSFKAERVPSVQRALRSASVGVAASSAIAPYVEQPR